LSLPFTFAETNFVSINQLFHACDMFHPFHSP
jgi:hypothetical protein